MVPAVPTKPNPDTHLVPVSKEGGRCLFIKVNTKKSIEKEYTEEEEGHTKSPLEEMGGRHVS